MSFCYKVKRIWRVLFNGIWIDNGKRKPSGHENPNRQLGLKHATHTEIQGGSYCRHDMDDKGMHLSHGIQFTSKEEKEGFESKMEELQRIFLKELSEIKRQHERLKVGRVILKRRFSELEHILQTDIKRFTSIEIKSFIGDSSLSSEEIQLLAEMEEILEQLEREQEELLCLEKCLEIELHERTFYPEPVLPRHRKVEDEFSKQMKEDGGLKYESSDKTIQFIAYSSLPPPLSLDNLLQTNGLQSNTHH